MAHKDVLRKENNMFAHCEDSLHKRRSLLSNAKKLTTLNYNSPTWHLDSHVKKLLTSSICHMATNNSRLKCTNPVKQFYRTSSRVVILLLKNVLVYSQLNSPDEKTYHETLSVLFSKLSCCDMNPLTLFILAGSGGLSSNSVIMFMIPSQRSTLFVFDTDNDVEAEDELCFSKIELLWAITLLDTVKNVFCWDNVVEDVVVEWKSLISWKFFVDSNFFAQLMSELLVAVCFWYWILCSDDLFVETLCILARIDCMESMPEREQ